MHVGRSALALDFVCLTIDQDGEHVAPRKHGVNLDLATIQPALPALTCPVQFQPVPLPVDGDVVDHENRLPVTDDQWLGGRLADTEPIPSHTSSPECFEPRRPFPA